MRKYLFIVSLVGVCSGQIVPDTLVMKSGKTYLGTYYGKDSKHTEFKYQKSMDREKLLSSKIEEIRLGDGSKVKKTIIKTKDCYLDGVEQAKIDFQSEGFVNGLGCGIVPIFGYIIGSLIVNIMDVDTPYGLYRNLKGDCRMDYDMGYKEEAKKLKKKNFNQGILVSTGIFIVVNYLADAAA